MEPVKGGNLVNLPERAKAVLDALHGVGGRILLWRYGLSRGGERQCPRHGQYKQCVFYSKH